MGWQAMAGKVSMKPVGEVEQDFAAWADEWVDRNCHLPPGGDHSWREREAQRIFGDDAEEPLNSTQHLPPAEEIDPTATAAGGSYEPGFKRPRTARSFILPVSLAVFAVLAGSFFLLPESLQSRFEGTRQPGLLPDPPVRIINEATAEEKVTPNLSHKSSLDAGKAGDSNPPPPQQVKQAVAPVKEMVPPRLRLPITERRDGQNRTPAARVAKAPESAPTKRAARSRPPIGATYFAGRARTTAEKKQVATTLPPIGQAYFESHSPAAAN